MKTTKKKSKLQLEIEKSNRKFVKSTKAEQRVMIAKDVIARVDAKQFLAEEGSYVYVRNAFVIRDKDAREYVRSGRKCTVCAKGGLLMSLVGFVNSRNIGEVNECTLSKGDELFDNDLTKIFTENQLKLIETAFEGREYDINITMSEKQLDKAKSFYYKHMYSDLRLLYIMENIVKNKGTFKL